MRIGAFFVLLVAAVVFVVYAAVDCALYDRTRIRGIRRGWWILVILLVPIIGALLWFLIGRGRANRVGGTRGTSGAPDDDPDFLRRLDRDSEQEERIRRLEQELADLDTELDDDGTPEAGGAGPKGAEHKHPDTPDGDGAAGGRPNA